MKRVRLGKRGASETGFIVTWDVDSSDATAVNRVRRFVFGQTVLSKGKVYTYPGFVEREGVRYLGQSVLFVRPSLVGEIDATLSRFGVDHEVTSARLG